MKLVQLNVNIPAPATKNGMYLLIGTSVVISNAGDEDATINDFWVLKQGESLQFSASREEHVISFQFKLVFDGSGVAPLVQFAELKADLPGFGNYVQK